MSSPSPSPRAVLGFSCWLHPRFHRAHCVLAGPLAGYLHSRGLNLTLTKHQQQWVVPRSKMADFPNVGLINEYEAAYILLQMRYSDDNPSLSHRQQIIGSSGEVAPSGNDEQTVGTAAATSFENLDEVFSCPHCDKSYSLKGSLAVSYSFTWARIC